MPSIIFNADIALMDLECPLTWDLISAGNTKGCFQLESRLGRSIAKKLKPSNIEELAALISIMRPGCLEAIRDGKSVTNHYIDKKNGLETVDYFHESLEPILKTTYGEMVYQEQAMEIARVIAGFNLQEADMLRKAIGKKKPEEMAKLKITFIDGCEKVGSINKSQAEEIFNWIEKSQRYSFNKSHAISYAMNSYLSAYAKAHYARVFFASYLRFAKDKIDPQMEIKELVQNATEMNIVVCNPDIRMVNEFVELDKKCIYFGLTDIKGVGKSAFDKLKNTIESLKLNLKTMTWMEYLFLFSHINSTASKALIQSGALDFLKIHRNRMLFEYNIFNELTAKETENLQKVLQTDKSLQKNLEMLVSSSKISSKRQLTIMNLIESLKKPPYSLEDTIEWLADTENMLIGCSISCSKVDMYDISMVSSSCKDFKNNKCSSNNNIILAGEIENIRVVKTKKGKSVGSEMAFITLNDGTASLDSIVYFPEAYRKYRNQLFLGNIIIVKGNRSKDKDSLSIEKTFIPKA
jgi:DNA polymerase-3 subunit alpha